MFIEGMGGGVVAGGGATPVLGGMAGGAPVGRSFTSEAPRRNPASIAASVEASTTDTLAASAVGCSFSDVAVPVIPGMVDMAPIAPPSLLSCSSSCSDIPMPCEWGSLDHGAMPG